MALRVRYSNFDKKQISKSSGTVKGPSKLKTPTTKSHKSFEDNLNIVKLAPNETVLYRLHRPRPKRVLKIDTGSAIDKRASNKLPKLLQPIKRSKLLNFSTEEKRCISVLRSRIIDVVNEIQKERSVELDISRSNTLPSIQKKNEKKAEDDVTKLRPKTHHVLLRSTRTQSVTSRHDDLTLNESMMLKQVLTDILRRKLREESERDELSLCSNKKLLTSRSGSRPQSGLLSRASNLTSENPKKDKGTSDVISEITNSGDNGNKRRQQQQNERQKFRSRMPQQGQRPQVRLFSVAGSSRGSTADWIMRQKFEKYRS